MSDEFDYNNLWNEEQKKAEIKIEKEVIPSLPKGLPRRGVNITKRFRVIKKR
jgi:hypothetical protein